MICDSHCHLKHGNRERTEYSARQIVEAMDGAGIDRSVVFAMCVSSSRATEFAYRAYREFPDRLIPYAYAIPHISEPALPHVELARDIAQRFNHIYGETFVVPEPIIPEVGARIMGLSDPTVKMSKSEAHVRGHAVRMLDEPAEVERSFKRAVTDSGSEVRFSDDPAKAGVNNLLEIYRVITGKGKEAAEADFANAPGYGFLKQRVAEVVIQELRPIRERYTALVQDPAELDRLLARGAEQARAVAEPKLREVQHRMGLVLAG